MVSERETGDKATRAKPLAAMWQHRQVDVVRASWNTAYLDQMRSFPSRFAHDDAIDASAAAFDVLVSGPGEVTYQSWSSDKVAPVEILRRQWMGSTVAPVKDWTIDATTIRAAAQLANASTTDVQRVALGLPPAVGDRAQIFAGARRRRRRPGVARAAREDQHRQGDSMPMIDEAMIRRVCERTGCSPTAARRVSLGQRHRTATARSS